MYNVSKLVKRRYEGRSRNMRKSSAKILFLPQCLQACTIRENDCCQLFCTCNYLFKRNHF